MYITKNAYIFWKSMDTRKLELWKCLATGAFAVNVWALLSLQAEEWGGHSALQSLLICPQWVNPTLQGPCSSIWECWKASRALRVSPMCVCSESLPSGCPVDFRSAVMGNPCKGNSQGWRCPRCQEATCRVSHGASLWSVTYAIPVSPPCPCGFQKLTQIYMKGESVVGASNLKMREGVLKGIILINISW